MGGEMNEARMRMTRIPRRRRAGANKVSGAPGFWIGNVIVMAGVPSIMQAMLDEVAPKLKTGTKLLSETIRADAKEGDLGTELGEVAKAHPDVDHRQLSVFRREARTQHQYRGALARSQKAASGKSCGRGHAEKSEVATRRRARADGQTRCRHRSPTARRDRTRFSPSRGTSSTAIPARSPGGCMKRGRSRRSSASPAADWCRRR